jgi:hypothetical protein
MDARTQQDLPRGFVGTTPPLQTTGTAVMDHSSTRDTGALGELAEQLKTKGDAGFELLHLLVGKLAYFKV